MISVIIVFIVSDRMSKKKGDGVNVITNVWSANCMTKLKARPALVCL